MGWSGHLALRYQREGERTVAHDRHRGPLRVLKALYPEGPGLCHHVLVHPPGGIVGGDTLEIDLHAEPGTHALVTTPGATRFYRSAGAFATQHARLRVDAGARLEWLPVETIAYPGCLARNEVEFEIAAGGEMIGWDLLALGLPAAAEPFASGQFGQHLEWPGVWLERGAIDAADTRLLDSPLGLAGRRVMATAWFASGAAMAPTRRDALQDAAREALAGADQDVVTGVTSLASRLVLVRALAHRVEPLFAALTAVRATWRHRGWQLDAPMPRVWRT